MVTITVFTPTYNRAYCLGNLYNSLIRQTSFDFLWLIIDDGSTDNTEELVNQWISNSPFDIIYHKQFNQGKMNAHNKAVLLSETELFMCCDSDDFLTDDAIEKIVTRWSDYHGDKEFLNGVIGLKRCYWNKKEIVYKEPLYRELYSIMELGLECETLLAFRTDIINKYPFPVFPGEKFIPEDNIYKIIDRKYKMLYLKDRLMICEYRNDGYTKGNFNPIRTSPNTMAMVIDNELESMELSRWKCWKIQDYIVASIFAKKNVYQIIKGAKEKVLTVVLLPSGMRQYRLVLTKMDQYRPMSISIKLIMGLLMIKKIFYRKK